MLDLIQLHLKYTLFKCWKDRKAQEERAKSGKDCKAQEERAKAGKKSKCPAID